MSQEAKIRQFLLDSFLLSEDEDVSDTDSFIEKGVLDSTGVLELVAFLEEEFGVKVADEELTPENLDSIALVAAFVTRKKEQQAASA